MISRNFRETFVMGALEGRYPSGADTGQGRRRRHLTDAIDERLGACENASLHLGLIFFGCFLLISHV